MVKLMLTVTVMVIAAAMISAILEIINPPAESRPILDPVLHTNPMPDISSTANQNIGRLTLIFVPVGEAVDRN